MTEQELDKLIEILKPECDLGTIQFVKQKLMSAGVIRRSKRLSQQQAVDPFERPISNDPVDW